MDTSTDAPPAREVPGPQEDHSTRTPDVPDAGEPELAGARGRRPWFGGAVALTSLALVLTFVVSAARDDTADRLQSLTGRLDRQAVATHRAADDLGFVVGVAESVYATSHEADPAARESLARALEAARAVARQRVADAPPLTVGQAEARLRQAEAIDESLRWAAEDLARAVDRVGGTRPVIEATAR